MKTNEQNTTKVKCPHDRRWVRISTQTEQKAKEVDDNAKFSR